MGGAIKSFLIGCYVLLRGRSSTATQIEPTVYRYTHFHEGRSLNVMCQRIKHTVVYERWFMLKRVYRTYKVAVVSVNNEEELEWPTAFYPEMVPWFLVDSAFSYFQAINAYIDGVIEGVHESKQKA